MNLALSKLEISPTQHLIVINSVDQSLTLYVDNNIAQTYAISTSQKGLGEIYQSYKTPRGFHRISEKIGDGVPNYGIFKNRKYVGEAWKPIERALHYKDYVSTRILRLEGLEYGKNKGRDYLNRVVDTAQRVIYIHGTTAEWLMGKPSTEGCIYMTAEDIKKLFEKVPTGTLVWIG